MSDNLDAQPGGRLLALPKELRLLIYEQLFTPCKVDVHAPRRDSWIDDKDRHVQSVDTALLTTCRTIYAEAVPILYANTEFYIRFACSGPDLYFMKCGKFKVYSRLLQDMQGRVRTLLKQAQKVSLSIVFTDNELWEESEKKWFQQLLSELARLGEASKLKQLHITFEVDENSFSTPHGDATIRKEFEHVLGMLSETECHAVVTIAVHTSLGRTDFKIATYLDTVVKLQWADITHEMSSKKLAIMLSRQRVVRQEIQNEAEWIASRSSCYDHLVKDTDSMDFLEWGQLAQTGDCQIDAAIGKIGSLKEELHYLELEIFATEGLLEWFSHESWAHNRAH